MTYFISQLSVTNIKQKQIESSAKSLQRAKQALIAYAASRGDTMDPTPQPGRLGYLPCPANNNGEGNSEGVCDAANQASLGWFPWRSLGLPPLRDESGACLLYAVSGSYKYNPEADMLNDDSYGMFQVVDETLAVVEGINPEDRAVAVVIAPGKVLPGQDRNYTAGTQCGDDIDNFDAYLDTFAAIDNSDVTAAADQIDQFISATIQSASEDAANPHNDRLMTITRNDIWQAVMQRKDFDASVVTGESKTRRVAEALAQCLVQYGNDNNNRRLPFPAPVDLAGADYRDAQNYNDAPVIAGNFHFGRFPYVVNDADAVIPGTIIPTILFDKDFTAPPAGVTSCNNLPIQYPAGANADLRSLTSEDRIFWENRKDHFFYAVSDSYRPNNVPAAAPVAPRCGTCISVDSTDYAAVVIYSGSKQPGQVRDAPIAPTDVIDTKQDFNNYIEVNNAAGDGTGDYTPTGNDIMFCVTDTEPLDVVPCP